MMRFELGPERPDPKRALVGALTIASAYAAGGALPPARSLFAASAPAGRLVSVAVTLAARPVFGYATGHSTGAGPVRSALQTVVIGGLATGAACAIARAIS